MGSCGLQFFTHKHHDPFIIFEPISVYLLSLRDRDVGKAGDGDYNQSVHFGSFMGPEYSPNGFSSSLDKMFIGTARSWLVERHQYQPSTFGFLIHLLFVFAIQITFSFFLGLPVGPILLQILCLDMPPRYFFPISANVSSGCSSTSTLILSRSLAYSCKCFWYFDGRMGSPLLLCNIVCTILQMCIY
jgi:hypothetical protein